MKQSDLYQDSDLAPGQFVDKKHEGHSGLSRKNERERRKQARTEAGKEGKEVQLKYIDNLQRQVTTMETEIKMLKEKEVEQKNRASGYETLLRDKIPLNEHFLALKNKFNNERDNLKKRFEAETKRHDNLKNENKKMKESINSSSREVNIMMNTLASDKEKNQREMRE